MAEPDHAPHLRGGWLSRLDPAWLRLFVFLGGLGVVLTLILVFRRIFGPLLAGLAIAYLFDPFVSWFETKGRSRVVGVVALVAILLVAVTGLVFYLVPAIGEQAERLAARMPDYRAKIDAQFEPLLARLQAQYPEELAALEARLKAGLSSNLPNIATKAGEILGAVASNALQLLLALLNLIFVPVFAFYLLVDFPRIKEGAFGLVPVPYRETVGARLAEVNGAVSGFVRGQLTIALVLAAINATGLAIIGVPMGIALGILAGLANMIPYMALVIGLVPSLLLCWVEYQSLGRLVAVIAVFAGAQMLEGTVLSPRILGKSVDLHPVWVLLAVIAGGSLFGFLGMLLAVPTAAAIQVFIRHWVKAYKESGIYRGERSVLAP